MYTPVEIITIAVLTISNPITLYQLYKRHKRKVALRQWVLFHLNEKQPLLWHSNYTNFCVSYPLHGLCSGNIPGTDRRRAGRMAQRPAVPLSRCPVPSGRGLSSLFFILCYHYKLLPHFLPILQFAKSMFFFGTKFFFFETFFSIPFAPSEFLFLFWGQCGYLFVADF